MKRSIIFLCVATFVLQAEVNECDRLAGNPSDKSLNGVGVEFYKLNIDKAIAVCSESVKKNPDNIRNIYELGRAYHKKKEYEKAVEFYQKAADKGYTNAQYNLGVMYDNGWGVRQDYIKAVELYQKAADQGNADALSNLGVMYESGQSVKQDYKKAVELFEEAAAQGNAFAQINLGEMYVAGKGVKKDYVKARELFKKAAAQGNKFAEKKLGTLDMLIMMEAQ